MATSVAVDHSLLWETEKLPVSERTSALRGFAITFRGLLFTITTILVGMAALNSEANLLFLLFSMGIGVLLFSAMIPIFMLRRIEVDRIAPQSVVAGRPFSIVYNIHSRRRLGKSWSLTVGECPAGKNNTTFPLGYIPSLPAGQEQRLELIGQYNHRGHITLNGVRIQSRFPFGLFSCKVDHKQPAEFTVYPALGWLRRDAWRDRRFCETSTSKLIDNRRGTDEFYGVREYREGDSFRFIHWRRSAHAGQLVIRESVPFRATQLIVLLDPWPTSSPQVSDDTHQPDEQVERVISAAATAACDGLERGHRVGLIARAQRPIVIPPAQGRPHRQRLLHELATLTPCETEPLDELLTRIRWTGGWHARCLICTTQLTENHQRTIRFLNSRAESIIIASPGSDWLEGVFAPLSERNSERRSK